MQKRRYFTATAACVAFAAIAGVSIGGCADTEGTFYVRNAFAGTAEEDGCLYDPESAPLFGGTFEVLGGGEYKVGLTLVNELNVQKDTTKPRVETMHVEIYAADVSLDGVEGTDECPVEFTYPAKGFAEPQTLGGTAVLAIPGCVTSLLAQQMQPNEIRTVTATFVVHGHTTGGDEVESPEYEFPISVGRGSFCSKSVEVVTACGIGVNAAVDLDTCEENAGP